MLLIFLTSSRSSFSLISPITEVKPEARPRAAPSTSEGERVSKPSDGYYKQLRALASEVMVLYVDAEKLSPINAFFAVGLKPQIITTKIILRYAKATA